MSPAEWKFLLPHSRLGVVVGFLLLVAQCCSTTLPFDYHQLSDFKAGQTTYSEVVSKLSQPTLQNVDVQGDREAFWIYDDGKLRPSGIAPSELGFGGQLGASGTGVTQIIQLRFNEQGVLLQNSH